jgi:hypothetical protein
MVSTLYQSHGCLIVAFGLLLACLLTLLIDAELFRFSLFFEVFLSESLHFCLKLYLPLSLVPLQRLQSPGGSLPSLNRLHSLRLHFSALLTFG